MQCHKRCLPDSQSLCDLTNETVLCNTLYAQFHELPRAAERRIFCFSASRITYISLLLLGLLSAIMQRGTEMSVLIVGLRPANEITKPLQSNVVSHWLGANLESTLNLSVTMAVQGDCEMAYTTPDHFLRSPTWRVVDRACRIRSRERSGHFWKTQSICA